MGFLNRSEILFGGLSTVTKSGNFNSLFSDFVSVLISRQEIQEAIFIFGNMYPGSIQFWVKTNFSKIWVLHLVPGYKKA